MSLTTNQRKEIINTLEKTSLSERQSRNYITEFGNFLELTTREDLKRVVDNFEYNIYIFKAKNIQDNCPIHINVHGGGFYVEHKDNDWIYSSYLADKINGIVVDVDYTTTKKAPFPVAINQVYDTAKYVFDNCQKWGSSREKVSMGGYSAGASITTAVTLLAIERNDFKFCVQILGYPLLDSKTNPIYKKDGYDRFMPVEREIAFGKLYYEDNLDAVESHIASPIYAEDDVLMKFPKTVVISCENCNFRYENEEFSKKLASIGVDVVTKRFLDTRHGFIPHFEYGWEAGADLIIRNILNS